MWNVDYAVKCACCGETKLVEHWNLPINGRVFECAKCLDEKNQRGVTAVVKLKRKV